MKPIKNEPFTIAVNKDNAETIFLALIGLGYHGWGDALEELEKRSFNEFCVKNAEPALCWDTVDVCRGSLKLSRHFKTFSAFLDWHFDKDRKTEAEKELDKLQEQIKLLQEQANMLQAKMK